MKDRLHQINVSYSGKEDRLLLRVTTYLGDEYRVWLTRRFTSLLYGVLIKAMEQHGGAQAIGSEDRTKNMFKSGALEKKFDEGKTRNLPFGEDGFLAYSIKSGQTQDGQLRIEILPETGKGVTLNLTRHLLYMMHNLLMQGIARAEWQLVSDTGFTSLQQKH